MSIHFDASRGRFVVRWKQDGRRRIRRFASEAEAIAFDTSLPISPRDPPSCPHRRRRRGRLGDAARVAPACRGADLDRAARAILPPAGAWPSRSRSAMRSGCRCRSSQTTPVETWSGQDASVADGATSSIRYPAQLPPGW